MKDLKLKIDTEKCVHCGLCMKDCSACVLEFDENKIPKVARGGEKRCIECQHCLAVCPTGALSILDKSPDGSETIWNGVSPNALLNLIKSRRSFRHYKRENISVETMEQLKNMLNWVPTGVNNHKLHFAFIENIEIMDAFREHVNTKLINILQKVNVPTPVKSFARYKKAILNGQDIIFRGAPHMVAVSVPVNAPCADIDPTIALSYFELYAQSLGVATCWCGLAEACLKLFPELCEQLQIPEGYKASYVMLFGPADIKYSRTTQPEPFLFTTVEKIEPKKLNFSDKFKRYFWNIVR